MSSGYTRGMIMPKILVIVADGTYHISFIDLHMIDIIKQFEVGRSYFFCQFDTPGCFITHIIFMIHFTVQQFHLDNNIIFFCQADDLLQTFNTIVHPGLIIHSLAIAAKADQVFITGFFYEWDGFVIIFYQLCMKSFVIPPLGKTYFARDITHRAEKPMFLERGPVFWSDQVNSTNSNFYYFSTKFFQWQKVVCPLANGVIDIGFHL